MQDDKSQDQHLGDLLGEGNRRILLMLYSLNLQERLVAVMFAAKGSWSSSVKPRFLGVLVAGATEWSILMGRSWKGDAFFVIKSTQLLSWLSFRWCVHIHG